MRHALFLLFALAAGGCAPSYLVSFSEGYDPATSYTFSLPTIQLEPGQTRRAFVPARSLPFTPAVRLASENPEIARVWLPFDKNDAERIQALLPGNTIVHRGVFPFPDWDPKANPVRRAEWRRQLRRFLSPRPDDTAFRNVSDADLWRTVLRSRSQGALRVIVEEDPLKFTR